MLVNSIKIQPTGTGFKGTAEQRVDNYGRTYYNTTRFFREDLALDEILPYLDKFYKDKPRVDIVTHGCSDGEETYSIKFKLKKLFGKNADKYFVSGRDFDSMNILDAKKGIYEVSPLELFKMQEECGMDLYKYISVVTEYNGKYVIHVRDYIKDQIFFKKSDITKDIGTLPQENLVLGTRNMWPYLAPSAQIKLAENLSDHLKPSSFVLIGHFDISNHIQELLEKVGFQQTGIYGMLRKCASEPKTEDCCDARIILNKIKAVQGKIKMPKL